ncbi:MAG: hypothetical protein FWF32_02935 [Endomicrobia bacterium]|nr:hypothetical protein [Endomicrobiia bacterium]
MKNFITKHCFLVSFVVVSIIWSVLVYNPLYESSKDRLLINSLNTYMLYANPDADIVTIKNTLEDIISDNSNVSVSITKISEPDKIIYNNIGYKESRYKNKPRIYGIGSFFRNDEQYEYKIAGQHKYILPVALIKLWSFSIIPDINRIILLQSLFFWLMVVLLWNLLLFYKKEGMK